MIDNGILKYIRSDDCPEFIAKDLRSWLSGIGVKIAYIELGNPWGKGFCESFNDAFRNNLLDEEIFYGLKEAQIIVGEWVKQMTKRNPLRDNHVRFHSALDYRLPTPKTKCPNSFGINSCCYNNRCRKKLSLVWTSIVSKQFTHSNV